MWIVFLAASTPSQRQRLRQISEGFENTISNPNVMSALVFMAIGLVLLGVIYFVQHRIRQRNSEPRLRRADQLHVQISKALRLSLLDQWVLRMLAGQVNLRTWASLLLSKPMLKRAAFELKSAPGPAWLRTWQFERAKTISHRVYGAPSASEAEES